MPSPKKPEPTTVAPEPASADPEAVPAYDSANLDHVLERVRGLVAEAKRVSVDLAAHYRKHSRTHHTNGEPGLGLAAPAAHDPVLMARLHTIQAAVGEFVNIVKAQA
jgi:hypothetical protein